MGNPQRGSKQWDDKITQTRVRKQRLSLAKLAKSTRVLGLVRAARRAEALKWDQKQQDLRKQLEAQTLKANKYYRELGPLKAAFERSSKALAKRDAEVKKLRALSKEDADNLGKTSNELNKTRKELRSWVLFWGWVKTNSRPATLAWLQRLWQKGPRRAPDACWGGGQ